MTTRCPAHGKKPVKDANVCTQKIKELAFANLCFRSLLSLLSEADPKRTYYESTEPLISAT